MMEYDNIYWRLDNGSLDDNNIKLLMNDKDAIKLSPRA